MRKRGPKSLFVTMVSPARVAPRYTLTAGENPVAFQLNSASPLRGGVHAHQTELEVGSRPVSGSSASRVAAMLFPAKLALAPVSRIRPANGSLAGGISRCTVSPRVGTSL